MEPGFKPNTRATTKQQYTEVWTRWLTFLATKDEAGDGFTVESYAEFLQGERHAVSCSALRHIYKALNYELPPTLKELTEQGLYTPAAPAEKPANGETSTPSAKHRTVQLENNADTRPIRPEDVDENEVVKIGKRLYRRTGSAWAEVDGLGRPTGAVATHPFICRVTRAVYRVPQYEHELTSAICRLEETKATGALAPEEVLLALLLRAGGTTEAELFQAFSSPTDAAKWLMARFDEKTWAATGADPVTAKAKRAAVS